MDGYCVWVDTIKKIASFHHVEQSDFMHFLHLRSKSCERCYHHYD